MQQNLKSKYYSIRKVYFRMIFLFLSVSLSMIVFAQTQSISFNHIGTENGLVPGNVNDIIQDSLGFIWLGTESGLCRYDGYEFKLFKRELGGSSR